MTMPRAGIVVVVPIQAEHSGYGGIELRATDCRGSIGAVASGSRRLCRGGINWGRAGTRKRTRLGLNGTNSEIGGFTLPRPTPSASPAG